MTCLLMPSRKHRQGVTGAAFAGENPSPRVTTVTTGGLVARDIATTCDAQTAQAESVPKPKRLCLMDDYEDDNSDEDVVSAVMQYLSSNEKPTDEERTDPLLYWKNSKHVVLASLARTYLTANASSVPCEAMFSISRMLLNGRCSSLAPHTFNRLIFLHDNGRLQLSNYRTN